MSRPSFLCALVAVLSVTVLATAVMAAPKLISYQGKATDASGNAVTDGSHPAVFEIYDQNNNLRWSESATVTTTGGLFTHNLGSVTPFNPSIAWQDSLLLQVTFAGQVQTPRTLLTAAPYAQAAGSVETINGAAGGMITDHLIIYGNVAESDVIELATAGGGGTIGLKDVDGMLQVKLDGDARSLQFIDGAVTTTPATITSQDSTVVMRQLKIGDSTMTVNADGIRIGNPYLPSSGSLLYIDRNYASGSERRGIRASVENEGAGAVVGMFVNAGSVSSSGVRMGERYGMYAVACNDIHSTAPVYGLRAEAGSTTKTAGLSFGVYGVASAGVGSTAFGVYGLKFGTGVGYAGYFDGNVHVTGTLSKAAGSFKIDHPLDPENKYLQHSFVESPDMKNIYDGVVVLDAAGTATVTLPDWFEALNRDFRYQLTCVGGYAPVYIAQKVAGNRFTIAGGTPGLEVSWMVTGIRRDAYAEENRIQVEVDKAAEDRGKYLHPAVYGQPEEMAEGWKHRRASHDEAAGDSSRE